VPLTSPKLDDRTYQQLLDQLVRRIPVYTPEWTDHNASDPGITLLQLFSYLGEQLLYRFNQIPDKNYVEFLRLIGVTLRPASSASAHLTVKINPAKATGGAYWIKGGSQFEADTGGDEPAVFETTTDLQATVASLDAVVVGAAGNLAIQTEPEELPIGCAADGVSFLPFGSSPAAGTALYLGFSEALPKNLEFRLVCLRPDETTDTTDLVMMADGYVGPPADATRPTAVIAWEWWDGTAWQALDRVLDTTAAFERDGEIRFRVPGAMAAYDLGLDEYIDEEKQFYWLRGRIDSQEYESPPALKAVLWNAVAASHSATVLQETLGRSDGEPSQSFSLAYKPLLPGTLTLQVEENGELVGWQEVPDLLASGPQDRHFTVDAAAGTISFGDGTRGRIPEYRSAVVAASYKQGGGVAGNVAAGKISTVRSNLSGVDTVTNPFAATGGEDEEELASAQQRAPRELKTLQRAVSASDYEAHALAAPGGRVARALAVPLMHPSFPGVQYPGAITVLVVPRSEDPAPRAASATLEEVRAYLDQIRTVTAEVYVARPRYREVAVEAEITLASGADPSAVQSACLAALDTFLHTLTGGSDGTGWPWGGTIYYSDLFGLLQKVEGVKRVTRLTYTVDGQGARECADQAIGETELVSPGTHRISVLI
jgi:predicted phage baseplate assembly protein